MTPAKICVELPRGETEAVIPSGTKITGHKDEWITTKTVKVRWTHRFWCWVRCHLSMDDCIRLWVPIRRLK